MSIRLSPALVRAYRVTAKFVRRYGRKTFLLTFRPLVWLVGFARMERFFLWLASHYLGVVADPIWGTYLQATHRRDGDVRWSRALVEAKATPRRVARHTSALITARRFEQASRFFEANSNPAYFHKHIARDVDSFNALRQIIDIELLGPDKVSLSALGAYRQTLNHIYSRIWDMHGMQLKRRVGQYVRIFLALSHYDPESVVHLSRRLLFPNGLFKDAAGYAVKSLDLWYDGSNITWRRKGVQFLAQESVLDLLEIVHDRRGLYSRVRAASQLRLILEDANFQDGGDPDPKLLESIPPHTPEQVACANLLARHKFIRGRFDEAIGDIERILGVRSRLGKVRNEQYMELYCLLGRCYENLRDYKNALHAYRTSARYISKRDWVNEPYWLLLSTLMQQGQWAEAYYTFLIRLPSMWHVYDKLAKVRLARRIKRGSLIPRSNVLVLGGWGIGDELIRLAMLKALRRPECKYGFLGDPRLVEFLRGNDWLSVYGVSRVSGPFAVSEEQYWIEREGVAAIHDRNRITTKTLELIDEYREIMLSEDLMVEATKHGAGFRVSPDCLVHLTDEERRDARQWISSLPGKLKVGISWRSGDTNVTRSPSYTSLTQWGDIFSVGDVDFINLQYSDTSAEVAQVKEMFGVDIHHKPDVDLKDDLRKICAIAAECDVVLAPCTAMREMAGAVGAPTWSLTTTPFLSDLWRVLDDGETDRLFPSIRHISAEKYGGIEHVLSEIARRLRKSLETGEPPRTIK